jgi:formylglycine-generating enzyme required for sulfatase activity
VELTRPFQLGSTEVTVGQFRQFVEESKYQVGDERWQNPGQSDDHPVVFVSWQNAVDFCTWLSDKEGKRKGDMRYYLENITATVAITSTVTAPPRKQGHPEYFSPAS